HPPAVDRGKRPGPSPATAPPPRAGRPETRRSPPPAGQPPSPPSRVVIGEGAQAPQVGMRRAPACQRGRLAITYRIVTEPWTTICPGSIGVGVASARMTPPNIG